LENTNEHQAAIQTVTLWRQDVVFTTETQRDPWIVDWRLRISDLELMNSFSIRAIRNPQFNGFSVHLSVLRVSVVNKALEFFL